jgi:rRNA-processing protein FCF1
MLKSGNVDVDSLILRNLNDDTIVATQDAALKRELLKKGASVIILRQKKYLQLVESNSSLT